MSRTFDRQTRYIGIKLRMPLGMLVLAGSLAMGSAGLAQTSGSATGGVAQQGQNCVVPPQTKSGRTGQPGADGTGATNLSDCNGVLTPPAVGDGSMVAPAPPVGETPVIRPQDVPTNGATGQTGKP